MRIKEIFLDCVIDRTRITVSNWLFHGKIGRGVPHIRLENLSRTPKVMIVIESRDDQQFFEIRKENGRIVIKEIAK